MNEANYNQTKRRSPEELDKLIINTIAENPNGVQFKNIFEKIKISPSTLSKHLVNLRDELRIEKKGNLYQVEGLGSYRTIINICISEIEKYLNDRKEHTDLSFVLDELLGSPGNPVPVKLSENYMQLMDPHGIDIMFSLITHIRDKTPDDLMKYEMSLVQFATGAMIKTYNAGNETMEVLWKKLHKLEAEIMTSVEPKDLHDRESVKMKTLDRFLYTMAQCRQTSWDVIDGMLGLCDKSGQECFDDLYSFMVNSSLLSSDHAVKAVFDNQGKLFTLALNSKKTEKRVFLQKFRRYAIEIHNQENGSSSKHTETGSIMNQDMGRKPD